MKRKQPRSIEEWSSQTWMIPPPPRLDESFIKFLKCADKTRIKDGLKDLKYVMQAYDDWCEKEILSLPDMKSWTKDEYPFKEYVYVEELLRKFGKEFIEDLFKKCPIKNKKIYNIYDSVALVIFNNKIDPWSLFKQPQDRQSLWDKISEDGQV